MPDKVVRTKELRGMPVAELSSQLQLLRKELWQQRVKTKDGSLQQTHRLGQVRRQIARIHTIMKEQHT